MLQRILRGNRSKFRVLRLGLSDGAGAKCWVRFRGEGQSTIVEKGSRQRGDGEECRREGQGEEGRGEGGKGDEEGEGEVVVEG